MKRLTIVFAALIGLAAPAYAQFEGIPQLQADGTGTASARPDTVIIDIGVTSRGTAPTEALAANSRAMNLVIDAIRASGIDDDDINTSGFSISPVYSNQRPADDSQPRIVAYDVSNQVTVRIRQIDASGNVLDQVVAAGANRINSIRFDIDDPQPLQDEAMQAAIADAIRKAELMAEAAGVRLVRILSVSAYGNAQPVAATAMFRTADAVPIMAGEHSITATASITWEIAPLE